MQIGNLTIAGKVLLAPMAGITDLPFRRLCRRFGAAIVYSEFLSSDGLILNTMNQQHKLALANDEHPVAYQLFGAKTELFAQAASALSTYRPDLIDLNFGCPVKKVIKGRAGAAILKDLDLLHDIVASVSESVAMPVTVKIRAGWDARTLVYNEAAERAVAAGAKAVTLHARTRADGNWSMEYGRGARWEWIADLKDRIADVPIIGNGDVVDPMTAKRMFDETGCDAIMIARAAIGRPWIFAEINHFLETGELLPEPSAPDRLSMAIHNLKEKSATMPNERATVLRMRRLMAAYIRCLPGGGRLRRQLMTCEAIAEVQALFGRYLTDHPDLPSEDGDEWLNDFVPLDRSWMPAERLRVVV